MKKWIVVRLLIDYTVLMRELAKLEVHPVLLKWIATFLTNRQQAVRIGGTLKGGVPQGTKLGVIFFTVSRIYFSRYSPNEELA